MTIAVTVPDELAEQAQAAGVSIESYIERLLQQQTKRRENPKWVRLGPGLRTPAEAVADIRELRKGVTLGGLKIKDLINEGRKY